MTKLEDNFTFMDLLILSLVLLLSGALGLVLMLYIAGPK